MAECLSEEQLENLAANSLPPEATAPLQDHLANCPACREALAECQANRGFALTVKTALGDRTTVPGTLGNGHTSGGGSAEEKGSGSLCACSGRSGKMNLTPFPETVAGYELQQELRRGAQGVVYRAIHSLSGRTVAIKFLSAGDHASESSRRRFEREIELVRGLHHPNIIRVWDCGTSPDGCQYYVMDYVAGVPLSEYVRERKLTLEQTLDLFVSVCDAVNYAHQRGVIHRDLKPSNILVDTEGILRVLDFGLAKLLPGPADTGLSLTGQIMGTLPYMSPEQARGRSDHVDIRTDVYSLGVVLYQLLTGGFPYPVTGPVPDVLRSITETPPEPPSKRWSKGGGVRRKSVAAATSDGCPIDDDIETILLRALAKDPGRRYQNVAALMDDVALYLRGQPIEARREARLSVLTRTMARYRAAALLACAGLLLIASFAVALAWLYRDASQQREQAAQDRAQAIKSQVLLASALMRLGDGAFENGNEEDALGQYLAALAIKEHLATANIDNLSYQKDLADTLLCLGDLCKRRAETTRASAYYRRFRDLMEQLASAEPQNPDYQAGLVQGQARLAALGDPAAATSRAATLDTPADAARPTPRAAASPPGASRATAPEGPGGDP